MVPLHIIRQAIWTHVPTLAAVGVVHHGRVWLKSEDGDATSCTAYMSRLMRTAAGRIIRSRLSEVSCKPGLHSIDVPYGLNLMYGSLDHIAECAAGVFVIRCVESPTVSLRVDRPFQSWSRKERRRIQRIVGSAGEWLHPEEPKIQDWVTGFTERLTQEAIRFGDEAFSKTLTSYKDFVSSFSHEALSPIQELRTSLELTISGLAPNSETHIRLASSLQALDHLRVALEGMRLLFRDDEQRALPNQFRHVDVRPIVSHWCELYRTQLEAKNIKYILESPARIWTVRCVPEYVEVLVQNLVNNAVKYSFNATGYDTPGKFVVRFDTRLGRLSFINFGVPISRDEIESGSLFTNGHRGRAADDRGRVGKGVGLHLVKRVVDLHDATCNVASEIQNPGGQNEFARTEFTVQFSG